MDRGGRVSARCRQCPAGLSRERGARSRRAFACALRAGYIEQRQREAAPGGFAADNDSVGRIALGQKKPVGGAGVQQAGGKWVLRCEAVFGQKSACAAGGGEVRYKAAVGPA